MTSDQPIPNRIFPNTPQIPKGACLNWNKTTRTFQVYLHAYKTDSATGEKKKTRISLGALKENGDFQISRTWQLSKEKEELRNLLKESDFFKIMY